MNKKIAVISVLIAVLFVSSIAGTAFYYKVIVNSNNSKIASLNTETANLTNQLSNLESQMPANLVTNLTVTKGVSSTAGGICGFFTLNINGTVTNTGEGTAHNAGLHVVAYGVAYGNNGTILSDEALSINITVPLASGEFNGFGSGFETQIPANDSYSLTDLNGEQSAQINLEIVGNYVDSNWIVTPVWTNSS
jgi:hypothetical protein